MLRLADPQAVCRRKMLHVIIISVKTAGRTVSSALPLIQHTFITVLVTRYGLTSLQPSAAIYESFFLWWSSLFLPANKPLAALFRSSLAQRCLGQWIALSYNLSWGHFPVITFFFLNIWLSLSLFFTTVICGSPTCTASCGTVTSLLLKRSRTQPFSPSIWPLAREALIQDGSPLPPLLIHPPTRGVMSQWSKVAGWPLLLPNLYSPALAEW